MIWFNLIAKAKIGDLLSEISDYKLHADDTDHRHGIDIKYPGKIN